MSRQGTPPSASGIDAGGTAGKGAPEVVRLALVTLAAVSAVRGAWSPCGLSMLSTITPLSEHARHHAYWRSATWFVLGALLGGLTLGGVMASGSWASHRLDLPASARLVLCLVVAIVCLAADARIGGLRLPDHPRQVDATWVTRLRPWSYAGGFGWQLGTGVATYVMTNAVYTVILVAMVWLGPDQALALGVVFGACRGATILAGAAVTTPSRLHATHRWLAASDVASLALTMAAELWLVAVCVAAIDRRGVTVVGSIIALGLALGCAMRVRTLSSSSPVAVS